MSVAGALLVVLIASFIPIFVHAQTSDDVVYSEIPSDLEAPLKVFIEITSPTVNGLYVENRPVTVRTTIKNVGDQPVDISATGTFTKLDGAETPLESIAFEQKNIFPDGETSQTTSKVLEAGNYGILVFAQTQEGKMQAARLLFVVSSHQELLIRQQAEFAKAQAESAAGSANTAQLSLYVSLAAVTVGGVAVFFAKRAADKQHNLTEASNQLLRLELHERLRPILRIVDSSTELRTSKDPHIVRVRCILQNLGSVPARAAKYWYKTTESKTIDQLVQEWSALKSGNGHELGSLLQNASQELMFDIPWPAGLARQNVALLLECTFLENTHEETVAIMDVTGGLSQIPQRGYTQKDIDGARSPKSNP